MDRKSHIIMKIRGQTGTERKHSIIMHSKLSFYKFLAIEKILRNYFWSAFSSFMDGIHIFLI